MGLGRASIGGVHTYGALYLGLTTTPSTRGQGAEGFFSASEDGFVVHGDQSCGPWELSTWPPFTCPTTLRPAKTHSSIQVHHLSSSRVSRRPRWHSLIRWTTSAIALSPSASRSPRRLVVDGLALKLSLVSNPSSQAVYVQHSHHVSLETSYEVGHLPNLSVQVPILGL